VSPTTLIGPLISNEYERAEDNQQTSRNAIAVQWGPRPWLPINAQVGINTQQRTDKTYVPYGVYNGLYNNTPAGTVTCAPTCGDTTGSYGLGRGTARVTTINLGTAIPLFNQRVTLAGGGNFYATSTEDFSVYTNQLSPGVTEPTSFLAPCNNDPTAMCNSPSRLSTSKQSTYGWYVEPRLYLFSRFFISPGFRLDGGSGAAKSSSHGLSAFPKVNVSYLAVDRQDGRPLWGVLSQFRPRLSIGFAGTQPAPADKLRLYNIGSYQDTTSQKTRLTSTAIGCAPLVTLDGETETPAVCINALGNTLLRPERSIGFEGGFDVTLWQDRLSFTYTNYNKVRHDAILTIPVAPSVFSNGVSQFQIQKNVGVIKNTGVEMTMTATILESRSFGWTVDAGFSKNTNKVVRLNKGQLPIVLAGGGSTNYVQTRVEAGYPVFGVFTRPIVGYADSNQNGIIDANEIRYGDSVVYVGQAEPNYQLNVSSNLTLLDGRLGIHTGFAYENGLTQYNQGACSSTALNLLAPNPSPATQAAVVAAGCPTAAGQSSIGLVQVVNTFRFQTLSVNYNVPKQLMERIHVPLTLIALQGSNLGLHTNYQGKDPNVNAFATVSAGDQARDTGQIPTPRTWWLRFQLGN
jgi:hypothetical protein